MFQSNDAWLKSEKTFTNIQQQQKNMDGRMRGGVPKLLQPAHLLDASNRSLSTAWRHIQSCATKGKDSSAEYDLQTSVKFIFSTPTA